MKTLVIDDLRSIREAEAHAEAIYARTPDEGVAELEKGGWELVCLDHDMGFGRGANGKFEEWTIWPCMVYIEENAEKFENTIFYIITSNPWGAERMEMTLKANGLTAYRIDWTEKERLFVGGY